MSNTASTALRPTLAKAVNDVFFASNEIFALAERLVGVAEGLPAGLDSHRADILNIASDLAASAKVIVRGQQSAVEAISRKTAW